MSEVNGFDQKKRDRVLAKIKKCFALSESNNPHEAEAAMRQARKLMDKFHVELTDVHAIGAEEYSLKIGAAKSAPQKWVRMLSMAVAKAFGCASFYSHGAKGQTLIFIGEIGSGEMAAYAYEVLSRQLGESRRSYLASVDIEGTQKRRRAAQMYAEAWIIGVHKRIEEFAGVNADVEKAIKAYQLKHYPGIPLVKLKRRTLNEAEYKVYLQGEKDGSEVSLHHPMGHAEKHRLN